MKPTNHRIISLAEACKEFNIENILGIDFEDLIAEQIEDDPDAEALVFDGDTEFQEDINMIKSIVFGEEYPFQNHPIIIVNGNLKARNIHMDCIDGLFVFGDMECEKINFYEAYPVYVQGNLIATKAILATASKQEADVEEMLGLLYVRVQGTASSSRVQTWFMSLQHFKWTSDSGKEFAEDKEDPHNDKWFSDLIWDL